MKETAYGPIPGSTILPGVSGQKTIVMAANTRIATVAKGYSRQQKTPIRQYFMELARSECDLKGGYTGLTPRIFQKR